MPSKKHGATNLKKINMNINGHKAAENVWKFA
jgi:hypothetical protein